MSNPKRQIEPTLNIPRRDVLEGRHRSILKRLNNLHEEYELERADLETSLSFVEMQMQWQGFSQTRKELIARILELPEISGVYEISVEGRVVYVGEAVNIRARAISHLSGMWRVGVDDISPKLYRQLAVVSPADITITAEHIDVPLKKDRLKLESEQIRFRISQGHPVTNVSHTFGLSTIPEVERPRKPRADRRVIVDDEDQWDRLLHLMSEELRDTHYIRKF